MGCRPSRQRRKCEACKRQTDLPKGITHHQKSNVSLISTFKDSVAVRFDHVPVGNNQPLSIELLLK